MNVLQMGDCKMLFSEKCKQMWKKITQKVWYLEKNIPSIKRDKNWNPAGIFFTFPTSCRWLSVISGRKSEEFSCGLVTHFFFVGHRSCLLVCRLVFTAQTRSSMASRQLQLRPTHTLRSLGQKRTEKKPLKCRYAVNKAFVGAFFNIYHIVSLRNTQLSECYTIPASDCLSIPILHIQFNSLKVWRPSAIRPHVLLPLHSFVHTS